MDFVLAEVEGGLSGFEEAGAGVGGDRDAVLDDEEVVAKLRGGGRRFRVRKISQEVVDTMGGGVAINAGYEDADVGLAFEVLEDFGPGEVVGFLDAEGDDQGLLRVSGGNFFPDGLRGVVLDFFAGDGIETFGDVAEPDFEEVGEFGHRADGGAGGFDRVCLLDGDRGTDVFDGIDFGFVEEVEELAGVGGEGFDVAALSLGVERVENERGFAGAAQAGDDDVFAEREIEVKALEVVLADAAQADGFGILDFRVWIFDCSGGSRRLDGGWRKGFCRAAGGRRDGDGGGLGGAFGHRADTDGQAAREFNCAVQKAAAWVEITDRTLSGGRELCDCAAGEGERSTPTLNAQLRAGGPA